MKFVADCCFSATWNTVSLPSSRIDFFSSLYNTSALCLLLVAKAPSKNSRRNISFVSLCHVWHCRVSYYYDRPYYSSNSGDAFRMTGTEQSPRPCVTCRDATATDDDTAVIRQSFENRQQSTTLSYQRHCRTQPSIDLSSDITLPRR